MSLATSMPRIQISQHKPDALHKSKPTSWVSVDFRLTRAFYKKKVSSKNPAHILHIQLDVQHI